MHLVIGGTGLVGSAIVKDLERRGLEYASTYRPGFDLLTSDLRQLPEAEVVYLAAAMPGFAICEWNRLTWQINVDAQIKVAKRYREAFIVYVSSDAVEIASGTAYARQKVAVEAFIHTIDGAIIRPAPINKETAPNVAALLVDVGLAQSPGVYRWPQ